MKKNKNIIYLAIAVVVLIGIALIGKKQGWFGNKEATQVVFGMVKKGDITEKVSASGTIQPEVEVEISPEVPGEIIELNIEEGDSVIQGELMVKIRPDNFISALERARANLNQQQANLADSRARLARAEAQFKRSELDFERQKELYDGQAISVSDYEVAEANYKIAQQDLESARQNVIAAEFIVKSARASVDEAAENLRRTSIVAPMSGTVSQLNVELGERVVGTSQMAGTVMLRIANLNQMEVRVDVNENDIIRINKGDTAIIDVDSYTRLEKTFKGIVTQIASTANNKISDDAVTEFEVRIRILNESFRDLVEENGIQNPFKPGMTASVEILTDKKENITVVPLAAVTTRSAEDLENESDEDQLDQPARLIDDYKEVVFVHEDGTAKMVEVKTGISDYENIEVISGLQAGQEVITGPYTAVSKQLRDGDPVELRSEKKGRD